MAKGTNGWPKIKAQDREGHYSYFAFDELSRDCKYLGLQSITFITGKLNCDETRYYSYYSAI